MFSRHDEREVQNFTWNDRSEKQLKTHKSDIIKR
jgi:hypothetical protein